jgi:hypothetical protein
VDGCRTDEDAPDRFGHDRSPGVASGEEPGGVADSVGGWAVAVHVVENDRADDRREFDWDLVEGDEDSPVGQLGDLVVGHPQDPVQGQANSSRNRPATRLWLLMVVSWSRSSMLRQRA